MAQFWMKMSGVALAAVLGVVGYQTWTADDSTASAQSDGLGPLGVCGQAGYLAYRGVSAELSEFASGQSRDFPTDVAKSDMRAKLNAMSFDADKTHFVAAHGGTGETFVVTCENRMCTNDEAFAPEQECLTKHLGGCSMVAAIDAGTMYCLIGD